EERTGGVAQPAQPLLDDARRRQRHEVAWHDHARVAERGAVAPARLAVDDDDVVTLAPEVVSAAQADDAGSDDGDGAAHGMPAPKGSPAVTMRSPSALTWAAPVITGRILPSASRE